MPDTPDRRDTQTPPEGSGGASSGEFTQMFESLTGPAKEAPKPAAPSAKPSEFTQIFTPLAPPAAEPKITGQAQAPAAQPGEFTQFFSAISSREASSPPLPAPPVRDAEATAVFEALDKRTTPPPPSSTPQQAGAFTQLFQQIQAPAVPLPAAPPVSPVPFQAQTAPAERPQTGTPVFGTPPPQGSFTDTFQAVRRPDPPQRPSAPVSQPGGFTELFQAAPPAAPVSNDPFARLPQSPPPAPFAHPAPAPAAPPLPAYAPAAAPLPAASGGDFTRLMQSLEQPAAPGQAAQPAPVQGDPGFFSTHYASASGGESEYTRVLRGGSVREHASAVPAAAPLAGSAVAPGLAIAPAKQEEKKKDRPGKKLSPVMLLLIVMNALLVIVLIVVGVIFFHHK